MRWLTASRTVFSLSMATFLARQSMLALGAAAQLDLVRPMGVRK